MSPVLEALEHLTEDLAAAVVPLQPADAALVNCDGLIEAGLLRRAVVLACNRRDSNRPQDCRR